MRLGKDYRWFYYKNILNIMNLTLKEQQATLQCVWQVLTANPTQQENNFIQSTHCDWACLKNVDMSDAPMLRYLIGCEIKPWIIVAIQEDPNISFSTVRAMSEEKKQFVKNLILSIIESASLYNQRAPYAHTLFENCAIPFAIKGELFPDGHLGNKII